MKFKCICGCWVDNEKGTPSEFYLETMLCHHCHQAEVVLSKAGIYQKVNGECPTCKGDPYLQPCEDCGRE